jgi:hypothetical protein
MSFWRKEVFQWKKIEFELNCETFILERASRNLYVTSLLNNRKLPLQKYDFKWSLSSPKQSTCLSAQPIPTKFVVPLRPWEDGSLSNPPVKEYTRDSRRLVFFFNNHPPFWPLIHALNIFIMFFSIIIFHFDPWFIHTGNILWIHFRIRENIRKRTRISGVGDSVSLRWG